MTTGVFICNECVELAVMVIEDADNATREDVAGLTVEATRRRAIWPWDRTDARDQPLGALVLAPSAPRDVEHQALRLVHRRVGRPFPVIQFEEASQGRSSVAAPAISGGPPVRYLTNTVPRTRGAGVRGARFTVVPGRLHGSAGGSRGTARGR